MSRTRTIATDAILDAAERVVVREGAAGLSIDAVAREAGVSKSRVVYDHKTKSGLLEALIDRRIQADMVRVDQCVAANAEKPHPELFGRIAAAEKMLDDTDRAVAMAISASMSSEEKLQASMRDWAQSDLSAMAAGFRPKAALMAYFALTGFCCTELFDLHRWSHGERQEILEDIRTVYAAFPDDLAPAGAKK